MRLTILTRTCEELNIWCSLSDAGYRSLLSVAVLVCGSGNVSACSRAPVLVRCSMVYGELRLGRVCRVNSFVVEV